MGYTVSVKFKNQTEKDKMENFINSNQNLLDELLKLDLDMPSRGDFPHHICDYSSSKKNTLGFHNTITPEYIWDICAWMAVKSSVRNKSGQSFFYYDSQIMRVTHDPKNKKNTLVDFEGLPIKPDAKESMLYRLTKVESQYEKQRELMSQLNDAWNNLDLKKKVKP